MILKALIAIPCSTMVDICSTQSLDLCGLKRAETEQVISYPSKAQKYCSIVPHSTEKADKKS